MKTSARVVLAIIVVVLVVSTIHATADVQGLNISVQCPNVVLSWPSRPGEMFTVQYRPTLSINTPWVPLTTLLPAAANTDTTSFIHADVIPECPLPAAAPDGSSSSSTALTPEQIAARREEVARRTKAIIAELEARLKAAMEKARADHERWVKEGRPLPRSASITGETSSAESGSSQTATASGFYRVFKTSPIANADFFGIQQDSGANQLGIFDNDFDPDDDVFLLENVTPASHGLLNTRAMLSLSVTRPQPTFSARICLPTRLRISREEGRRQR